MNAGLSVWRRVLAIALLLAGVGAVWFALRWLAYDFLPKEIAGMLGALVAGILIGHTLGQRSARKEIEKARHSGAPNDGR